MQMFGGRWPAHLLNNFDLNRKIIVQTIQKKLYLYKVILDIVYIIIFFLQIISKHLFLQALYYVYMFFYFALVTVMRFIL